MYEVNIDTEADKNQVCFVSSISVYFRIGVNTKMATQVRLEITT